MPRTVSRPGPSTPARTRIRTPARSSRRSASRRRSRRTRSASTAATSTRAAATRPRTRWKRASRRSKARGTGSRSRAGSPPRTRSCARSNPATTSSSRTTPTAAPSGSSRACTSRIGVDWSAVDLRDLDALEAAWQPRDPAGLDRDADQPDALDRRHRSGRQGRARARRARSSSTTRSRRRTCRQPLALGADAVVHSSTKYLGGHSDVVGGFVALHDAEWADELRFLQNAMGAVPSPFDCYLVLRGVKTLAVRMRPHCENAQAIAQMLREHDAVAEVLYPERPHRASRARQMRDFGGMVSFLAVDEDTALDVVARTRLFTLAESLGAVESLIEHPARMTHASAAGSPLEVDPALGAPVVGIEPPTTSSPISARRSTLRGWAAERDDRAATSVPPGRFVATPDLREGLADEAALLELRLEVVAVHQRDEVDADRPSGTRPRTRHGSCTTRSRSPSSRPSRSCGPTARPGPAAAG